MIRILPVAPIQDAINLARFMVETTTGFIQFSITRPKTVGGPIEIAATTKHESFKWVQRKHFFSSDFNKYAVDRITPTHQGLLRTQSH